MNTPKGKARRNNSNGLDKLAADKDKAELEARLAGGKLAQVRLNSAGSKANGIMWAVSTDPAWMWAAKQRTTTLH